MRNNPSLTIPDVSSDILDMSFAEFLEKELARTGMRAADVARRSGVTPQNIHRIRRSKPHTITGAAPGTTEETVVKIAEALGSNVDEALIAAGYAPRSLTQGRPESLPELIAVLERAGITHIEFADADRLQSASPEELRDVIESVSLALEIALARLKRKEAATDAPRPAYPAEQRDRE